jgi:DeoR/GlpR family transcriptional regulator of sugar metabolism
MAKGTSTKTATVKGASKSSIRAKAVGPRPAMIVTSALREPRRMKMLDWFQEAGSARVRDLAEAFGVSEVTIRQDLERLEADGHIVREHGGAYLKSVPQQVRAMALHHLVNMEAKKRIGQAAAALVEDHETIILDAGSTITEIAMHLGDRQGLNIVTNALNIALHLGANPTFSVHMPGGQFKAPTLSLSGERSADYFEGLFAQKLFLATAAISFEAGLTFPAISDIAVKRAMIKSASKVYLAADSTKIGKTSFSSLGGIENIHCLITDSGIGDEDRRAFEDAGIEVIVA